MARGGRNTEVEKDRMESMETNVYKSGRRGSGAGNFQKPAFDKPAVANKSPKSAGRPA